MFDPFALMPIVATIVGAVFGLLIIAIIVCYFTIGKYKGW